MNDSLKSQTPSSTEKLSYKFILDELKERQLRESEEIAAAEPLDDSMAQGAQPVAAVATADMSPEKPVVAVEKLTLPEGKKYFRIGEVADLIGVECYVLRYWENEFKTVRPIKSKSGHRVYSAKDVKQLHLIRHLLHVEKFSVKGAKKRLLELRRAAPQTDPNNQKQRDHLKMLASEIRQLIQMARHNSGNL